jgi:hypothetical protein
MTDCQHQSLYAHLFAASPTMLEALENLLAATAANYLSGIPNSKTPSRKPSTPSTSPKTIYETKN